MECDLMNFMAAKRNENKFVHTLLYQKEFKYVISSKCMQCHIAHIQMEPHCEFTDEN